jgi:hypothetical protein
VHHPLGVAHEAHPAEAGQERTQGREERLDLGRLAGDDDEGVPVGVDELVLEALAVAPLALDVAQDRVALEPGGIDDLLGTEFLARLSEPYGGYMVAIMSLMESPTMNVTMLMEP